MNTLPTAIRPRIAQFVRLLGSNHDGEVVAAARAAQRVLRSAGASLNDLAETIEREPETRIIYRDHQEQCPNVAANWSNSSRLTIRTKLERAIHGGALKGWEAEFAASIAGEIAASRSWCPTPKQEARLDALIGKLHAKGAWA